MDSTWYICIICRKAFLSQTQLTDHRVSEHGMPRSSKGAWIMGPYDLLPSIGLKQCATLEEARLNTVTNNNSRVESIISVRSISSLIDDNESSENESPAASPAPKRKKKENAGRKSRRKHIATCSTCGKTFKDNQALEIHITSHSEDRPFSCEDCEKCFKNFKALKQHQVAIHKKKTSAASGKTRSIIKPKRIVEEETDSDSSENEEENSMSSNSSNAALNEKNVHSKQNLQADQKTRPTCSICSKEFKRNYDLKIHMASHTKERPFDCKDCGKRFKTSKTLKQHQYVHNINNIFGSNVETVSEDNTSNVTVTAANDNSEIGKSHPDNSLETETQSEEKSQEDQDAAIPKCRICHKEFKRNHDLKLHLASHSTDRPFLCESCGKSFKNSKVLKQHQELHKIGSVKRKHKSKSVNVVVEDKDNSENCENENQKSHSLEIDEAQVPHTKSNKDGVPTCRICSKVFKYNSDLKRHMISHSKNRPFNCKIYGKFFKHDGWLRHHQLTIHTEEFSFQCKDCPAKFLYKPELKRHSLTHLGLPLFECEICHMKFRRKIYLIPHRKTHKKYDESLHNKKTLEVVLSEVKERIAAGNFQGSSNVENHNNIIPIPPVPDCSNDDSYVTTQNNKSKEAISIGIADNVVAEDFPSLISNFSISTPEIFEDTLPNQEKVKETGIGLDTLSVELELKEEIPDEEEVPDLDCDFDNVNYSPDSPYSPELESDPLNIPISLSKTADKSEKLKAKTNKSSKEKNSKVNKSENSESEAENLDSFESQTSELTEFTLPYIILRGRTVRKMESEVNDDSDPESNYDATDKDNNNVAGESGSQKKVKRVRNKNPSKINPSNVKVKCPICHEKIRHWLLKRHQVENYGGIALFECNICLCRFTNIHDLVEHETICHTEEEFQENSGVKSSEYYQDQQLLKSTKNQDELKQLFIKSQDEAYKCPHCYVQLNGNARYNLHLQLIHLKYIKCPNCQNAFKNEEFLENHVTNFHTGEKSYLCVDCGKSYSTPRLFKLHESLHKIAGKFNCDQCDKKFNAKLYLTRHKTLMHGDKTERTFKCTNCPKSFYTKRTLAMHIRCCYNPEVKKALTEKQAKKYRNLNLECKICKCKFSSNETLRKHTKNIHSSDDPVKLSKYLNQNRKPSAALNCQPCGITFQRASNLRDHLLEIHPDLRPFSCDVCGKTFKRSGTLEEHKMIHNNSKSFICDVCGKTFKRNGDLGKHKRIHNDSKPGRASTVKKCPSPCETCGKIFSTAQLLKQHSAVHLSEEDKPFICEICSKKFSLKQHLQQHLRKHHKVFSKSQ